MKIAFTSCASAILVNSQPVWDDIRNAAPDNVVLLRQHLHRRSFAWHGRPAGRRPGATSSSSEHGQRPHVIS